MIADALARASDALLEGLPWPQGDPDGLATAAREAGAAASALRASAAGLASASSGAAGWTGTAAAAFHATTDDERTGMDRSAGALEHAAGALHKLSGVVRDAQEKVARLASQVRDAEEAAQRAQSSADGAILAAAGADLALATAGDLATHVQKADARQATDHATRLQGSATAARAHADEVRARAVKEARAACEAVAREDNVCAGVVDHAAGSAPLGGLHAPASATPAQAFAVRELRGLTKLEWQQLAWHFAGISHWNPDEGLLANDRNVQAVYKLYGDLWSEDHNLQWAGMANLVGPMFYAGWQDLYATRNVADPTERDTYLLQLIGLKPPNLPGPLGTIEHAGRDVVEPLSLGPLEHLGSEEIGWYERRFLTMQKEIFDDLAWKHVAYSLGGIGLMRELRANGQMTKAELTPFEQIATGDPGQVAAGNVALLHREQLTIIQRDYNVIHDHHGPEGAAFTWALTYSAQNPIPGGHSYLHDFHHDLHIDVPVPPIPLVHVSVPTPIQLPTGDISRFPDRWAWIRDDMVPAYRRLLQHPQAMQAIVDDPVAHRAERWRLTPLPYPGG